MKRMAENICSYLPTFLHTEVGIYSKLTSKRITLFKKQSPGIH